MGIQVVSIAGPHGILWWQPTGLRLWQVFSQQQEVISAAPACRAGARCGIRGGCEDAGILCGQGAKKQVPAILI